MKEKENKFSKLSKRIPFTQVTCEGDQSYWWYDLTSVFVIRALVNALIRISGYQYVTAINSANPKISFTPWQWYVTAECRTSIYVHEHIVLYLALWLSVSTHETDASLNYSVGYGHGNGQNLIGVHDGQDGHDNELTCKVAPPALPGTREQCRLFHPCKIVKIFRTSTVHS